MKCISHPKMHEITRNLYLCLKRYLNYEVRIFNITYLYKPNQLWQIVKKNSFPISLP